MALKDKSEVIKHSAAIHIENKPSLLERRTWGWLLANAYDNLPTHRKHTINIKELAEALEFESKDLSYLKDRIRALVRCSVEWNILGKDKRPGWEISSLLASARIESGTITYEFSSALAELLYNPSMYARINLSIQNKFTSKHALALYEIAVDYLKVGETPWIEVDDFRKLMGVAKGRYKQFRDITKWIIKPAIKDIGTITDIVLNTEYKRQGRGGKIVAVKFRIRQKPKKQLPKPQSNTEQTLTGLALELHNRKVNKKAAIELAAEFPAERVQKAINLFDTGVIKTPGGIRRALEDEWELSDKQERQVEDLEHYQAEENLEARAREIRDQRLQVAVKNFPKTKEEWADFRVTEAKRIRTLMTRLKPLSSDKLDEIHQQALTEYPETDQDKLNFIGEHTNLVGGLYDFRLDLHDIKIELKRQK